MKNKNDIREYTSAFYRKNRLRLAAVTVIFLAITVVELGIAVCMQQIIDASGAGDAARLLNAVIFITSLLALNAATQFAMRALRPSYVRKALRGYKEHAFGRVLRKGIGAFTRESGSRYVSALTNDIGTIEDNYILFWPLLIYNAVLAAATLAIMVGYSWLMTLIALGLSAIPACVTLFLGGPLARSETLLSDESERFVAGVNGIVSGFPVIKSFRAEKQAARIFERDDARLEDARRVRRRMRELFDALTSISYMLTQGGVFVIGAILTVRGDISSGVVIAFVQMMNYVLGPIFQIPQLAAKRKGARAVIEKLAAAAASGGDESGSLYVDSADDGIRLRGVSFKYDGSGEPALRDVSCAFERGKSYAIVGASGSGKSTLLNLLMGYSGAYAGSITLGGAELRELKRECIYDLISIIQQNVFIFDDTVRENVTMWSDFPPEAVSDALQKAGLAALIAERGEDYPCGENGSALSGGEKQRISIARSLLRGAPILLMDEATAALDSVTARHVESAILDIDGLTRIIVTHRLDETLLRRYDAVIVMSHGSVAESGSFDELVEKGGYFRSLLDVAG